MEGPSHPSDTTFYLDQIAPDIVDLQFVYYAIKCFKLGASDDVIPSLQRHELENFEIPVPPLPEQKKIALELTTIQKAVQSQQKEISKLKELKAATMAKLFREGLNGEQLKESEIGEIPGSWNVKRLGTFCDLVSGGTPSKKRKDWWNGDIPWASPKDMKVPRLWDVRDHITKEAAEAGSFIAPAKTIFVVIRGMILVKDVPVAITEVPMAFNQDMKGVIPPKDVIPDYLLYAIHARKDALFKEIGTSAHGTRRLGTSAIEEFIVPIPKISEQEEIAASLSSLDQKIECSNKFCSALSSLFLTTLHSLMTGQIRIGK